MGDEYAYQVYWVDMWGKAHYSDIIYSELEADKFADERMYAGAMHYDPPRVIVLEL